jgi:hypothetical protein
MSNGAVSRVLVILLAAAAPAAGLTIPDIQIVSHCQKQFASAGAKFAEKVIRATLKCTVAVVECQVQCDAGVFGPSCDNSPPPCCDSDDPSSNQAFGDCMADADAECDEQNAKIALYETQKQTKITNACSALTNEELCGANDDGLNFATLNAGCLALDPNYTCSLQGLMDCVGGPLQRTLAEQTSALLDPRAPDAAAAVGLHSLFSGLGVTRKVKENVPAGKADLWAISGQAGDQITVRIKTRDDNGNGTSNLHPALTLLGSDLTPVADTIVRNVPCAVPNVCGASCQAFTRSLPFNGTYYVEVTGAAPATTCTGGLYRLLVTSPSGTVPTLAQDDVTP